MDVGSVTLVAAAAFVAYAGHGLCRMASSSSRDHWIREQAAQPKRNRDEPYHLEAMDDKAYDSAKSSDAFWSWATKACPKAAPRPHTVKTHKGGGGT